MIYHFWDRDRGGFFFTADDSERLLIRQKEVRDGAVPSGNSVALLNLVRLARLTGTTDFEVKATQLAKVFLSEVGATPSSYTLFLTSTDFLAGSSCEIVLVGNPESDETRTILDVFRKEFVPNKVLLFKSLNNPDIVKLSHFTEYMTALNHKTTVYICRDFT
ncbi:MAG: hypothetical protein V1915_02785 [Candidatus Bathyarchaeota archaeon]